MTPPQPQTEDIRRDLQASLAARRELGTEYDEHFLNALVEKLSAQMRQEIAAAPRAQQPSSKLSREQRTGVAICSLIFGIPMLAISAGAGGVFGPSYFLGALALLAIVNIVAAR